MCDACFHRVLLRPAAVHTITADVFAAVKALEYVIIITNTIVIILLIWGGDVEPPNPSLRDLDSTVAQHEVRDHLFQPVIARATMWTPPVGSWLLS